MLLVLIKEKKVERNRALILRIITVEVPARHYRPSQPRAFWEIRVQGAPLKLILSLMLGTLFLEDATLLAAIALVNQQRLTLPEAFWACFVGIAAGDMILFGLGRLAGSWPYLRRRLRLDRYKNFAEQLRKGPTLAAAIVVSRALPGTRIPIYVGSGLIGYSTWSFFLLTLFSVFAWVAGTLWLGQKLLGPIARHWSVSVLVVALLILALRWAILWWRDPWMARASLYRWRRWTHFEFWPARFFYLPIVPLYFLLSLRHGSFFAPFYANPWATHGGLIGESKWSFLSHMPARDPATLQTIFVEREKSEQVLSRDLRFPLFAKPDVGERGFGVRLIRDQTELAAYISEANFDFLLQEKSRFEGEAGIFYVRYPWTQQGFLFSLTDKVLPAVVGDGKSKLGELILADRRARIMAKVYFARHKQNLDTILPLGQTFKLGECGNHCQGAIFKDGRKLIAHSLLERVEELVKNIPHFYFGRLDVRYRDAESLKLGEHFEIIEINGAGSEATHIWDEKTGLLEAYRVLITQWSMLFRIGRYLQLQGLGGPPRFGQFLLKCWRMQTRKTEFEVSS